MEMDNLYKSAASPTDPPFFTTVPWRNPSQQAMPFYNTNSGWAAAQWQVPSFLCPSDSPYQRTNVLVMPETTSDYNFTGYIFGGNTTLGRTNYVGVGGVFGRTNGGYGDTWQGIFTQQSQLTIAQIASRDGCSNTLFFGEAVGDEVNQYSYSWMSWGWMPTYWGLQSNAWNWYQFSSHHPGIVQFAMGDGSVHAISANAAPANWNGPFQVASGYRDGTSFNWEDLGGI
jgi:hypothetical protein